ncbi:MAG: membrane protein insertion efficiency factor YidD [Bacteriovoracaceae bacterium]|nr:membrane protein insertion efficiency factor YidD [Bacteriovoracaceae bacterium]
MIKHFFLSLLWIYQKAISPFFGKNCRYYPSCSQYSRECFQAFPAHKALWYSINRICRCHPYQSGGFDPIPKR